MAISSIYTQNLEDGVYIAIPNKIPRAILKVLLSTVGFKYSINVLGALRLDVINGCIVDWGWSVVDEKYYERTITNLKYLHEHYVGVNPPKSLKKPKNILKERR